MKGDQLPAGARVLRYASPTRAEIPGTAFVRSPKDTDGLSVNWHECFPGILEEQVVAVRQLIRQTLKKNGRFLLIDVDTVKAHLAMHAPDVNLAAIEDPLEADSDYFADPSHALLMGLPTHDDSPESERIGDLIAQCIIEPQLPGRID